MNESRTLGGRSTFLYSYEYDVLKIQFGKMKSPIRIKPEWIILVRKRVEYMKFLTKASLYNKDIWTECPNNKSCPYVAALIINNHI